MVHPSIIRSECTYPSFSEHSLLISHLQRETNFLFRQKWLGTKGRVIEREGKHYRIILIIDWNTAGKYCIERNFAALHLWNQATTLFFHPFLLQFTPPWIVPCSLIYPLEAGTRSCIELKGDELKRSERSSCGWCFWSSVSSILRLLFESSRSNSIIAGRAAHAREATERER